MTQLGCRLRMQVGHKEERETCLSSDGKCGDQKGDTTRDTNKDTRCGAYVTDLVPLTSSGRRKTGLLWRLNGCHTSLSTPTYLLGGAFVKKV